MQFGTEVIIIKESQFGKYYQIEKVQFAYGQESVEYALVGHQALTFRIVRKDDKWYIFVSLELPEVPRQTHNKNGIELDLEENETARGDQIISTPVASVKVIVIHTEEDWLIAEDCWNLLRSTVNNVHSPGIPSLLKIS